MSSENIVVFTLHGFCLNTGVAKSFCEIRTEFNERIDDLYVYQPKDNVHFMKFESESQT